MTKKIKSRSDPGFLIHTQTKYRHQPNQRDGAGEDGYYSGGFELAFTDGPCGGRDVGDEECHEGGEDIAHLAFAPDLKVVERKGRDQVGGAGCDEGGDNCEADCQGFSGGVVEFQLAFMFTFHRPFF